MFQLRIASSCTKTNLIITYTREPYDDDETLSNFPPQLYETVMMHLTYDLFKIFNHCRDVFKEAFRLFEESNAIVIIPIKDEEKTEDKIKKKICTINLYSRKSNKISKADKTIFQRALFALMLYDIKEYSEEMCSHINSCKNYRGLGFYENLVSILSLYFNTRSFKLLLRELIENKDTIFEMLLITENTSSSTIGFFYVRTQDYVNFFKEQFDHNVIIALSQYSINYLQESISKQLYENTMYLFEKRNNARKIENARYNHLITSEDHIIMFKSKNTDNYDICRFLHYLNEFYYECKFEKNIHLEINLNYQYEILVFLDECMTSLYLNSIDDSHMMQNFLILLEKLLLSRVNFYTLEVSIDKIGKNSISDDFYNCMHIATTIHLGLTLDHDDLFQQYINDLRKNAKITTYIDKYLSISFVQICHKLWTAGLVDMIKNNSNFYTFVGVSNIIYKTKSKTFKEDDKCWIGSIDYDNEEIFFQHFYNSAKLILDLSVNLLLNYDLQSQNIKKYIIVKDDHDCLQKQIKIIMIEYELWKRYFTKFDIQNFFESIKKINKKIFDFMLFLNFFKDDVDKGSDGIVFDLSKFIKCCDGQCIYNRITLEGYSRGFYNLILEFQEMYKNEKVYGQVANATIKQAKTQIYMQKTLDNNIMENSRFATNQFGAEDVAAHNILNDKGPEPFISNIVKNTSNDLKQYINFNNIKTPINSQTQINNRSCNYNVYNNSNNNDFATNVNNINNFSNNSKHVASTSYLNTNPLSPYLPQESNKFNLNNQLQVNHTNHNQQQIHPRLTCDVQSAILMQANQENNNNMLMMPRERPLSLDSSQNIFSNNTAQQTQITYPQQINLGQNVFTFQNTHSPLSTQQQIKTNTTHNYITPNQQQLHSYPNCVVPPANFVRTTQGNNNNICTMQKQQPLSLDSSQNIFSNNNAQQTQITYPQQINLGQNIYGYQNV
ncbi:hypothetical protein COBT_000552 [Conglomerata obtusa]